MVNEEFRYRRGESVLITDYILKHILDDTTSFAEPEKSYYTLSDFSKALEFTLISEGFQHNDNLYGDSIILKVRLNTIMTSKVGKYFTGKEPKSYIYGKAYTEKLLGSAIADNMTRAMGIRLPSVRPIAFSRKYTATMPMKPGNRLMTMPISM